MIVCNHSFKLSLGLKSHRNFKTMKLVLFLGFVAVAQGMSVQDGVPSDITMKVDFKPKGACIFGCDEGQSYTCYGAATIISINDNDEELRHGTLLKASHDDDKQEAPKVNYKGHMKRKYKKFLDVQGNCCWEFYQKYVFTP